MKLKKISSKMLVTILPIIIVTMAVFTLASISSSRRIINNQIATTMDAQLEAKDGEMSAYLDSVLFMATDIAAMVESSFETTKWEDYEKMLGNMLSQNELVTGCGVWFEPYIYDKSKQFMGPYLQRKDDAFITNYDYNTEEYNYFSQEFYNRCYQAKDAYFSNPYYDTNSGKMKSSCVCPMHVKGRFIGCITVDIEVDSITAIVSNIQVGKSGSAILTTGEGTYLAGVDAEKIHNGANITEDENTSLAKAGTDILATENGTSSFSNSGTVNLYYSTLANTGWKLILLMPQSELFAPINQLAATMLFVSAVAIIAAILLIMFQVKSIAKSIAMVQVFAGSLADGDFTVDPIKVTTSDEIGSMSVSLNQMFDSNKEIIINIKDHSKNLDEASDRLRIAASNLYEKFSRIQSYMENVNSAMLSTSAASEEVNASTEEVLANVNVLASETEESMKMAQEIRTRARIVGENSRKSYESANELSNQFELRLQTSIENAKVVESIGELAGVISGIAEQINLLSLNASIEAARAGEAGRGFAVVAGEIGNLASNTAEAVKQIQDTISDVKEAFDGLANDTRDLLVFVQETVAPDYSNFVKVASQYGEDAESIASTSNQISNMSDAIKSIMEEVTDAIQSITSATQDTTELSNNIVDSITALSDHVSAISEMSDKQELIVNDLNNVVGKFTLN